MICGVCALLILGELLTPAHPLTACECRLDPACSYVGRSDVIFLGKVAYSNDNGYGTFAQATLIRFEVEEAFKGLAPDVREVWVDPGSFTSCYATYPVGKRYLVFASSKLDFHNLVIMTVVNGPRGLKPPPPGFDPSHPPAVYLANECSGTREVSANTEYFAAGDLAFLRAWKQGKSVTRVYGRVLDDSYPAWPAPHPPGLQGATVTLKGAAQEFSAMTDSEGVYSFDSIPPGQYSLDVALEGYRAFPPGAAYDLAPGACGYSEFNLLTDGLLEGIVKDFRGHPAPRIELVVQRVLPDGSLDFMGQTMTDRKGAFRVSRVPRGDFRLGVNIDRLPTVDVPYGRFYYPGTSQPTSFHLDLHEHRKGLTFNLPPPLKTRAVNVEVTWADSTPVSKANVLALWDDGGVAELAETDGSGSARLICLAGVPYRIRATKWLSGHGLVGPVAAHSETSTLPREPWTGVVRLVMDNASHSFR
jgi:hypothetical protein